MVVMVWPSPCTASIRQERTGSPSRRMVQAPHTPCSQPALVPVSPTFSRRQSSKVRRGSTSTVTLAPLTSSSTRMPPSRRLVAGVRNGAPGERRRDAPAIGRRGMQVADRLQIGGSGFHCLAHRPVFQARSDQRLRDAVQTHRHIAGPAGAKREPSASAVGIERHLGGGRNKGEVAPARRHLVEAGADTALAPHRKAHGRQDAPRPAAP